MWYSYVRRKDENLNSPFRCEYAGVSTQSGIASLTTVQYVMPSDILIWIKRSLWVSLFIKCIHRCVWVSFCIEHYHLISTSARRTETGGELRLRHRAELSEISRSPNDECQCVFTPGTRLPNFKGAWYWVRSQNPTLTTWPIRHVTYKNSSPNSR